MGFRPGARAVVVTDVVAKQELAQPMARPHQVTADVLACPDEIAQRFLLAAWDTDRVQSADHQQTHEPFSIPPIGLDAVLRGTLDLPRRRDDTAHPGRVQGTRELKPGGPAS